MRRTTIGRAALALLIAGATALVGATAMSAAGAQTHQPSCSLHPTQHDAAGWVFENRNHERRFLTATAADGTVLYNNWLFPITQVGDDPDYPTPQLRQTPLLVGVTHVMWAADSYDVSEYANPDLPEGLYCGGQPDTTTTTAPPVVTVPPPTITTPPPSTVVTPTTTPTTEPPVLSCAADDRCETFGPAAPPISLDQQVGAAIPETLPVTGSDTGVLVMLGTSLLVLGAAALVLVRVRPGVVR